MRANARQVFDSLDQLIDYVRSNPEKTSKKTAFKVTTEEHQEKWILSGNSDQAIAGVCRTRGVVVESVPITSFLSNV